MIVILDLHVKYLNFNINSISKYSNRKDGRIAKKTTRNDTDCSPIINCMPFNNFKMIGDNLFSCKVKIKKTLRKTAYVKE